MIGLPLRIRLLIGLATAALAWGMIQVVEAQQPEIVNHPDPLDPRMLELDHIALDEAYQDTMRHLFSVWTRDETGQPARAIKGANQARRAYIEVERALDVRRAKIDQMKKERAQ